MRRLPNQRSSRRVTWSFSKDVSWNARCQLSRNSKTSVVDLYTITPPLNWGKHCGMSVFHIVMVLVWRVKKMMKKKKKKKKKEEGVGGGGGGGGGGGCKNQDRVCVRKAFS